MTVDMGSVWDRTTEFLRDKSSMLMPIAAAALLVPNVVSTLISGAGPGVGAVVVQAVTLLCALIAVWGQLAVIALALDPESGRARATSVATAKFGPAVAAMLILLVALAIVGAPIIGVLAASGADFSALSGGGMGHVELSSGATMFVSLYAILLTVAVLLVVVRLALLYPVIVAEGGVVAAIRRAWALSRGMVWKMIGVWLLFIIVYLVAAAAVTSAIGAVFGLFVDMRDPFSIGRIIIAILGGTVTTTFTLIVAAFSAKLYRAAIVARESVPAA